MKKDKSLLHSTQLNRRTLLKGLGVTAASGILGGSIGCAMPAINRSMARLGPSPKLINPKEEVAQNGLLQVSIDAQYGKFDLGGQPVMLRCYDGLPIGRTLRVKAGDTIRLSLHNKLPYDPLQDLCTAIPDDSDNKPRGFNVTNMHVHGVHVSPESPSDNILLLVGYQQSEHYVYQIPKDHPPGTYFYHAHFHGSVSLQVASGMAGALIIESEGEEGLNSIPEIAAAKEQVICFQTQRFETEWSKNLLGSSIGVCENYDLLNTYGDIYINGQLKPTITMRPGEVQYWRMVNASHMANMKLSIEDHQMTALCFDGNPLEETDAIDQLVLIPGNRADLLIKAKKPGLYPIHSGAEGVENEVVAYLEVTGDSLEMPLYSGTLPRPASLDTIKDDEVTFGRRLEFGLSGDPTGPKYTINGEPFSCSNAWQIPLNAVEEWEVYNHTAESHPFHIHVNPFQMISGGGVKSGIWLDTVNLEPFQRIRFRTRFKDYTGTFVFHCHNLTHEDLGMMQAINVYQPT